ncbi:Hint domain-containing protein [Halomonas caseinilytica]|uniref:Hint domain-containing protein n=1 Tax=Halomonas caseinilytica TaxID=438744 RepID=A0A1M7AAN2_9GAMM|nr:Hint domain-containing protein [Halomonas caseinilytica]SHL39793.1 Hint domain-containing protein [Halomonas caseinilytica]
MLNSYEVEFSGNGTGSFTFEKPTVSLLDNYTFNVKGMQEGDQLKLGGGEWGLDEGFFGWQDAYRDGQLNLVQGNDVVGGKVVARIEMTEEQYQKFLENPDAYLSGSTFTQPVCFAAGTMIATPDGETAVEALSIGDLVMTASGEQVPVKWIGRQTISRLSAAGNYSPVRIREGALAAGIPNQDLVLTASHGVILDDLVINAGALVNHDTIDYVPGAELPDSVTYYHIETDSHEVILANGTEAETYIDYVDRQAFDNYAEYVALYGIETRVVEMPRHRISSRRLLPLALRERLGIQDVMPLSRTA